MRFVYGKAHKLVEPAWYMVLDCDQAKEKAKSLLEDYTSYLFRDKYLKDNVFYASYAMKAAYVDVPILIDSGRRDGWFVNSSGGMTHKLVEVIQEIDSTDFPGRTGTISRWPNGTHYYVKAKDGTDLGKFGTKEEAEKVLTNHESKL